MFNEMACRFPVEDQRHSTAPHDIEVEQALLGVILIHNEAYHCVSSFLLPEHFFDPVHASIFEVAANLIGAGKQASPITLKTFFETAQPIAQNLTVPQYLRRLAVNATTINNAADCGRTIYDLAMRRQLVVFGNEMVKTAYDSSIEIPPCLQIANGAAALEALALSASNDGWPDPDRSILMEAELALEQIPLDGLGAGLAEYVDAAAEARAAPRDYVALALLTGAAGLIGSRRRVKVWADWSEPAILWAALVGDPSTNKSPAMDPIQDALVTTENEKMMNYLPLEEEYEKAAAMAKAARKAWEKAVEAAVLDCREPPQMPAAAGEPRRPVRPRAVVANATIEKLARILAEQPGGLICFRDELAGLLGGFDRYGGEISERSFYLEGYGGRPYRLDRVKDGSIDIPYLAISLLGAIQPDRLNRLVLSGDSDGLASRFLYAWPAPRFKVRPTSTPNTELLKTTFLRLSRLPFDAPLVLPFCSEGTDLFEAWLESCHAADLQGASGLLAEAFGKLDGRVARIALVLEYLRWAAAASSDTEPDVVSVTAIKSAIDIVERWAKPTLRRVFAEASLPVADKNARTLARLIARDMPQRINARELRRKRKADLPGIREPADMDAACSRLVDACWLQSNPTRMGGGRGQMAKSYLVNPRLRASLGATATSANSANDRPNGANGTSGTRP